MKNIKVIILIVAVLAISVTLWITGASLESLLQLPATLLSSAVIAIGAVALLSAMASSAGTRRPGFVRVRQATAS